MKTEWEEVEYNLYLTVAFPMWPYPKLKDQQAKLAYAHKTSIPIPDYAVTQFWFSDLKRLTGGQQGSPLPAMISRS